MTDKRIRAGIIGAGRMAREHARAFCDIKDVALVGIASRTVERAQQLAREFKISSVYDSAGELAAANLDLIIVAVSEHATVAIMRECAGKASALLVEKPVGLNLADCQIVHDLAKITETPVFVGLNRRSYGATRVALEALSADTGARFIEVHDQEDIDAARKAGRPEEVIRNWMFANSIHMIDLFRVFGRGDIVGINITAPWQGKAPAHVVAHLKFSSGDIGLYCAVWNMPGPWSCSVTTPERRVELRPIEQARFQLRGSRDVSDLPADPWDIAFKPGFRKQAEEIADFVRGGTKPAHVPDIAEALATTKLVAKLYTPAGATMSTMDRAERQSVNVTR